jgi:DNA-binding MarR family transcriptional regulator
LEFPRPASPLPSRSHRSPRARANGAPSSDAGEEPVEATARAVLDAFRSVARGLRANGAEVESELGAFPAQLHTLQALVRSPAASLKELAERTHTDPSSSSVVVQRLVERGLVARRPDVDDRRRMIIALTPAGRAAVARAPDGASARVSSALDALSDRERAALARLLDTLAHELAGVGDDANDARRQVTTRGSRARGPSSGR